MKRLLSLALAAACMFALVACGGTKTPSEQQAPSDPPAASAQMQDRSAPASRDNAAPPTQSQEAEGTPDPSAKVSSEPSQQPRTPSDAPVVILEDIEKGSVTNSHTGAPVSYSYSYRHLRGDIPGASAFNDAVQKNVASVIDAQLASVRAGNIPEYVDIWCDHYEYEQLHSFVFSMRRFSDWQIEYVVYYFDTIKNTMPDIKTYLDGVEINYTEEFLPAAAEAGKTYLSQNANPSFVSPTQLDELMQKTVHNVGQYPTYVYVQPNGYVYGVVPTASLYGKEYEYQILQLDLAPWSRLSL